MRGKRIIGFACGAVLSLTAVGLAIAQDERGAPFPDYGDEGVPEMAEGAVAQNGDAPPTYWRVDPKVFACQPEVIAGKQALTLVLGPGHGSELSVSPPGDPKSLFLVVGLPPADMKPLMTPEELAAAKKITIDADTMGKNWARGKGMEKIFTKPGVYEIYNSDALESEEGGYMCSVTYRP